MQFTGLGAGGMKIDTTHRRARALLRVGFVALVVIAFGIGGAGIALGASQTPNQATSAARDQYYKPPKNVVKPPKTIVVGETTGSPSQPAYTPPVAATSGTLPFTGVSLLWPAIAAVMLVGLGLVIRRHERKE